MPSRQIWGHVRRQPVPAYRDCAVVPHVWSNQWRSCDGHDIAGSDLRSLSIDVCGASLPRVT